MLDSYVLPGTAILKNRFNLNWAGEPRKMNIVKEEPALGGLSVEYTDYPDIRKRLAEVLGAMRRRP